jgi:hypothetical protein
MLAMFHAAPKSIEFSAVVLNADGTQKEDLGAVCYWHRNPFKRAVYWVKSVCTGRSYRLMSRTEAIAIADKLRGH